MLNYRFFWKKKTFFSKKFKMLEIIEGWELIAWELIF